MNGRIERKNMGIEEYKRTVELDEKNYGGFNIGNIKER